MSYLRNQLSRRHQSLKRQQGVIIVMALFMVALVAAMSYIMMSRLQRDTERTSLILRNTQAEFYAEGSIAWAMDTLRKNVEQPKSNQRVDVIPTLSPIGKENGFSIATTIYDMQSRYNLNLLEKTDAEADFKRLILAVYPSFTEAKAQEVVHALGNWLRAKGAQQNEFDQYYLERVPPYRAGHRLMFNSSELRLVKGVTPALFVALYPYVTALPSGTLLNVQTATAPVLMTLSPNLTFNSAKTIQEYLMRTNVASADAFYNLDIVRNNNITPGKLVVTSNYFLVETTVSIEDQVLLLYTLLERSTKGSKPVLRIVWQSKGIW